MPRTKPTTNDVYAMEADEAARRINVIIEMLGAFDQYDRTGDDDTGGYERSIMRDALLEIRNGLLAQAAADSKRFDDAARAKKGGA